MANGVHREYKRRFPNIEGTGSIHMTVVNQEEKIRAARELREHMLADRYRPGYHFTVPEDIGQPGDPNGAFFANGRYHLMYLYNRRGMPGWRGNGFCWGHVSSSDLVHWRHHPDALLPGDGDGGCFSGGAFVDDDGTAYLTYWRLPLSADGAEGTGIGIARSRDRHYDSWEKLRVPSLDGTEFGIRETVGDDGEPLYQCNADPSNIWKKDGDYYMEAGNVPILNKLGRKPNSPAKYRGDWVDLYRSNDLKRWEYLHRFYQRNTGNVWTQESEDDMCPSFLPLPFGRDGGGMSGKFLQLFISHNMGCQYYIGEYDTRGDRFIPEIHGRMTWADNTFFAPEALIDDKGRQVMWAWLIDNPHSSVERDIEDGWSGVYGLPRLLWLGGDGTLRMAPPPELQVLRYNEKSFGDVTLESAGERPLTVANGESCEIRLTVDIGSAREAGLFVRSSPDGEERTVLSYDKQENSLVFDSTKSGRMGRRVRERAPLELAEGETLQLSVFIDKSVVEVYANDRQAITRRVYPGRQDSDRVKVFCRGGGRAEFSAIRAWEMMPSNAW
jgi:beta-fructofuranosidase